MASPPATQQVIVRPVTSSGRAAAGYTVEDESGTTVCTDASPVGVSSGILECGSSADDTLACWASGAHTVLCLRDPLEHRLARIPTSSDLSRPVTRTGNPVPQTMTLTSGTTCSIRSGGAGSAPSSHPDWVAYYYCNSGGTDGLYATPDGSGIDRSSGTWTVQECGATACTPRQVRTAYFAGTLTNS